MKPTPTRVRRKRLLRLLGPVVCLVLVAGAFDALPLGEGIRAQLWSLNTLHYADFDEGVRARVAPSTDAVLPLLLDKGVELTVPRASVQGGRYDRPVSVSLEPATPREVIHYSLDGAIPTRRSPQYSGPLTFTSTTVLRFRSFRPAFISSPTVTHTYVVGLDTGLPVISLVAEPATLWSRYSGIYEHPREKGSKWSRDAHLEYVPSAGQAAFATDGNVRIHGGASRGKPKKSLRFTFPVGTETSSRSAGLFTLPGRRQERTVVLRAGGSNTTQHRIRDELFSVMYRDIGGSVSSFEPAILLLNGQLWGLYDLREYIDADYLDRHFGPDEYDLLQDFGISRGAFLGDRKEFDAMLDYFDSTDFRSDAAVDEASRLIDLPNFVDYWIANIYAANLDWPHHNTYAFRSRNAPDARWRWISWDADATFDFMGQGLHHDTLAWGMRAELRHDLKFNNHKGNPDRERSLISTLILRRLLQNDAFRQRFVARLLELLQTEFREDRMERRLQQVIAPVLGDLRLDLARWPETEVSFDANLEQIRTFFRRRPDILMGQVRQHFPAETRRLETSLSSPVPSR